MVIKRSLWSLTFTLNYSKGRTSGIKFIYHSWIENWLKSIFEKCGHCEYWKLNSFISLELEFKRNVMRDKLLYPPNNFVYLHEIYQIAAKYFYIKEFIWKQIHKFTWPCNKRKDAIDIPDYRHAINSIICLNGFYIIWH